MTSLFFKRLGFSQEVIRQGFVTKNQILGQGFNPGALFTIASLDGSYQREEMLSMKSSQSKEDQYLSPNEAVYGGRILEELHGVKNFKKITGTSSCWSKDLIDFFRDQVLKDRYYVLRDEEPISSSTLGTVSLCPFDMLHPELMEEVFFRPDQVAPPAIRRAAEAVFELALPMGEKGIKSEGSIVRITPNGGFLSASHIFREEVSSTFCILTPAGKIECPPPQPREDLLIKGGSRQFGIGISSKNILEAPRGEDWLTLHIPSEAGDSFIPIAKENPVLGEEVFAIGFPNLRGKRPVEKLISFGRVVNITEGKIEVTAQIRRGSSGGALINKKGELIGILSEQREKDIKAIESAPKEDLQRRPFTGGVATSVVNQRETILTALSQR